MRSSTTLRLASMLAVSAVALTGCASAESEQRESRASRESRPAPEQTEETPAEQEPAAPEPTAKPDPSLPCCEQVLPLADAQAIMQSTGAALEFRGEGGGPDHIQESPDHGPSAKTAFAAATERKDCTWAIPNSDGFLWFTMAKIPDAARQQFIADLRGSLYAEGSIGGAPHFSYVVPGRGAWGGDLEIQYAFVDPFVVETTSYSSGLVERVVTGLQAHR